MAVDMFLKLDGIKGESNLKGHEDEIEILSFSWGMSSQGGASSIQDFSVVKLLDTATPDLLATVCKGQHISEGTMTLRKNTSAGSSVDYMKVKLTDILISSYQTGGGNGGDPAESISFSFSSVEVSVRETDLKGGTGAWETTSCHSGSA